MSLTDLLNRPLILVRQEPGSEVDDFGNRISEEVTLEVVGEIQQQRRSEDDDEGELSDTRWMLFLPAGTDLDTGDAVICDGEVYEVIGDPWQARNPRTQLASHVEASLRRTSAEHEAS